MARLSIFLVLIAVALPLAGCGKDEGVTVQAGQGPSAADIDKQIAEVQANTHMPDGAKQAQISQLQAAKARADAAKK